MDKLKSKIIFTTSLIMGSILSRFAISKLTGWEISVKAFIEIAKPLGIDPTFFRISSGILISIIVIAFLTTSLLTLYKDKINFPNKFSFYNLVFFANSLGILVMFGALFSEFFLRIQLKWVLVYIAIGIILFSSINLAIVKNRSSFYLKLLNHVKQ